MRGLLALVLCAALLLGLSARAFADGDPAGEYLPTRQVFVLIGSVGDDASTAHRLTNVVARANRGGFAIRVAVIASSYDLGSVDSLWRRPRGYARFLGQELSRTYRQRLLVVMPDGFGFVWPSHSTAAAYRTLAKVRIAAGRAGEIDAARAAVRRLAAESGVRLTGARSSSGAGSAVGGDALSAPTTGASSAPTVTGALTTARGSGGVGLGTVILIAAGVMIALALALNLMLWRRGRTERTSEAPGRRATAPWAPGSAPARVRGRTRSAWTLPSLAGLFALGVAVPIVAVGLLRRGDGPSPQPAAHSAGQETPFVWGEGQRSAPDFTLRDQNDRKISPTSFHGRPVIVTFVDPLCRNLCPLEASVLNKVDESLPPARRPVIIAISVDVYADTHARLMLDARRWRLTPQWHWAVGSPSELKAVWKRYYAEVEVKTERIAGTTIHNITHSEMSYVLDGKGYERALFSWPFSAKAVERTLLRIEHGQLQ